LANLLGNEIISSKDFDYMIYKSCSYKAKVVEKDEKETNGLMLNTKVPEITSDC
jgi:3-dehydroquinate synthase